MMTLYIAYEGDNRLTDPTTRSEAEEAVRRARQAAGSAAARRIYRVTIASRMDVATMSPRSRGE